MHHLSMWSCSLQPMDGDHTGNERIGAVEAAWPQSCFITVQTSYFGARKCTIESKWLRHFWFHWKTTVITGLYVMSLSPLESRARAALRAQVEAEVVKCAGLWEDDVLLPKIRLYKQRSRQKSHNRRFMAPTCPSVSASSDVRAATSPQTYLCTLRQSRPCCRNHYQYEVKLYHIQKINAWMILLLLFKEET